MQLFLGIFTIGPWAALVIYDFVLYIFRCVVHYFPVYGGRARGNPRPRAPSLTERPTGHRRKLSMVRGQEEANGSSPQRPDAARFRHITEEKVEVSSAS